MLRLIAAFLLAGASAAGASESCVLPPGLTPAPADEIGEQRLLPVTKMVLAYYWWPESCQRPGAAATPGCQADFGFKVHGLWPDSVGKTYPQFCRAASQLTAEQVRANYCMIPSTTLLQHEWVKHGTCHWRSPEAYFGDTARVAAAIVLPDAASLPALGLTAGKLRDAVVAANPQLSRKGLFVGTNNGQWLTELWVCLTTDYRPMPCEDGNIGAPDDVPIRVRPRTG